MFLALTYHSIEYKKSGYTVGLELFRQQMEKLAAFRVGTMHDPICPDIVITFDDGLISSYRFALPILKDYKYKAYFFIPTGLIGNTRHISAAMLQEMARLGMVIGSHGITHKLMTGLTNNRLERELIDSRSELEDIIGEEVTSLSLPGGGYDCRVISIANEAGYKYIFTSEPRLNDIGDRLIGRVTMRQGMTLEKFESIIGGNLCLNRTRYLFLFLIKRFLGDGYGFIRRLLIK